MYHFIKLIGQFLLTRNTLYIQCVQRATSESLKTLAFW